MLELETLGEGSVHRSQSQNVERTESGSKQKRKYRIFLLEELRTLAMRSMDEYAKQTLDTLKECKFTATFSRSKIEGLHKTMKFISVIRSSLAAVWR